MLKMSLIAFGFQSVCESVSRFTCHIWYNIFYCVSVGRFFWGLGVTGYFMTRYCGYCQSLFPANKALLLFSVLLHYQGNLISCTSCIFVNLISTSNPSKTDRGKDFLRWNLGGGKMCSWGLWGCPVFISAEEGSPGLCATISKTKKKIVGRKIQVSC